MGPLNGYKVLDFSSMVSGPFGAAMLADQGAEVTKIEPLHGEQMRHGGLKQNGIPSIFYSCNRGKRSLAVDLKQPQGISIIHRLFETADVVIQNFRPGVVDRMGIGYEKACELNNKIVYVSISGFGKEGPYAHQRVYDPVIQALSGSTDIQADRQTGEPAMMRTVIADKVTSMATAQAVASALLHKERFGEGQHIDISMLDTMISFLWPGAMAGLTFAEKETDLSKHQSSRDLIYATKDGFITASVISDKEWVDMCRALGRDDLIEDPRFATSAARSKHTEERLQITADVVATFTSEEILGRMNEHHVPSAPILSRMDLLSHDQIVANESIQKFELDGFGEVRQASPAARFEKTPQDVTNRAPQLGEHSRLVLSEAGFTDAEIETFIADGLIKSGG